MASRRAGGFRCGLWLMAMCLAALVQGADGAVQVFDPNSDLEMLHLAVMFSGLVVFTVLVEFLTHKLDHMLHHHHEQFAKLAAKIYKELMILGMISFVLTMCLQAEQQTALSTIFGTKSWLVAFEFGHLAIFFLAIGTILQGLYFLFIMIATAKAWDDYANQEASHLLEDRAAGKRGLCDYMPPIIGFFGCCKSHRSNVDFAILHDFFLQTHLLPLNFDFSKYLWETLAIYSTEAIEIEHYTWLFLLIVVWLNYGRVAAHLTQQGNFHCGCEYPKYFEQPCGCAGIRDGCNATGCPDGYDYGDTGGNSSSGSSNNNSNSNSSGSESAASSGRRLLSERRRTGGPLGRILATPSFKEVAKASGTTSKKASTELPAQCNVETDTYVYHHGNAKKTGGRAAEATASSSYSYSTATTAATATTGGRLLGSTTDEYEFARTDPMRCGFEGHFNDLLIIGFAIVVANLILTAIIYRARRKLLVHAGLKNRRRDTKPLLELLADRAKRRKERAFAIVARRRSAGCEEILQQGSTRAFDERVKEELEEKQHGVPLGGSGSGGKHHHKKPHGHKVRPEPAPGSHRQIVSEPAQTGIMLERLHKSIFPCGAEKLIYYGMDILITANAFYLATFLLFYFTQYAPYKNVLAFLPWLINFFVLAPVNAKAFSFVHHMISINGDVVGKIMEAQASVAGVKEKIRKGIKDRMEAIGVTSADLKLVFEAMDNDGSGHLDGREFRKLLESLQIFLSVDVHRELMRAVDPDHSGTIDFEEFDAFIKGTTDEDEREYDEKQARVMAKTMEETGSRRALAMAKEGSGKAGPTAAAPPPSAGPAPISSEQGAPSATGADGGGPATTDKADTPREAADVATGTGS